MANSNVSTNESICSILDVLSDEKTSNEDYIKTIYAMENLDLVCANPIRERKFIYDTIEDVRQGLVDAISVVKPLLEQVYENQVTIDESLEHLTTRISTITPSIVNLHFDRKENTRLKTVIVRIEIKLNTNNMASLENTNSNTNNNTNNNTIPLSSLNFCVNILMCILSFENTFQGNKTAIQLIKEYVYNSDKQVNNLSKYRIELRQKLKAFK